MTHPAGYDGLRAYARVHPFRALRIAYRNRRQACTLCGSRNRTRRMSGRLGVVVLDTLYLCEQHDHA